MHFCRDTLSHSGTIRCKDGLREEREDVERLEQQMGNAKGILGTSNFDVTPLKLKFNTVNVRVRYDVP